MRTINFLFLFIILFACNDDNSLVESEVLDVQITEFRFDEFTPSVSGVINQEMSTIDVEIPHAASLIKLIPTVNVTENAIVTPTPGVAYDFTNNLNFKVTLGDVSKTYLVKVTNAKNNESNLLSFKVPEYYTEGIINDNDIQLSFLYGTDLAHIVPEIEVSSGATIAPESGEEVDLSNPVVYTVTSQSGEKQLYTVAAVVEQQETAIRAFWIPATWHSPFLSSYDNIKEGVELANDLNFNTLYVCAWSQTRSLYPSQVLADNSSYNTPQEGMFSTTYSGGSGDPLQDLIEEAHKYGLKVILWYEYGFMSKFGVAPTPSNDKVLEVHPDWVGINNEGTQSNYNGSDFYYNAYDSDVQDFMLGIIMEAVTQYDIDGIQGDDRLPAMPRNSGYDEETKSAYYTETGKEAPSDYDNYEWVRFRADILNDFAIRMYEEVKQEKPNCIVGFSPNPYPWAFENLMQEWPVWLEDGIVQILSVQCYRSSVYQYGATIDEVLRYYTQSSSGNLETLSPGVLLKGSSGLVDPEILAGQILENRKRGIYGESFFYDVPLGIEDIQNVIKGFYPGKANFPDM